ncbi:Uncharacterized protein HZ326_8899 [Fusarium oxysporum f. sp. albedinis]|nr:Uncharacterized protein HZ326_8899 [Fusarium oxysporum f. sp. albedinis]
MGVVVKSDAALFLTCTAVIQAFTTYDKIKQGSSHLYCSICIQYILNAPILILFHSMLLHIVKYQSMLRNTQTTSGAEKQPQALPPSSCLSSQAKPTQPPDPRHKPRLSLAVGVPSCLGEARILKTSTLSDKKTSVDLLQQ